MPKPNSLTQAERKRVVLLVGCDKCGGRGWLYSTRYCTIKCPKCDRTGWVKSDAIAALEREE